MLHGIKGGKGKSRSGTFFTALTLLKHAVHQVFGLIVSTFMHEMQELKMLCLEES